MTTNKPTKPTITIPASFAANGVKTDFDSKKLSDGFGSLTPDVLPGDCLNKLIDDLYKASNYMLTYLDFLNESNITKDGVIDFTSEQKGVNASNPTGLTTLQQVQSLIGDPPNKSLSNLNLATALTNLGFGTYWTGGPPAKGYFKIPNPNNTSKPYIIQFGFTSRYSWSNEQTETVVLPISFPTVGLFAGAMSTNGNISSGSTSEGAVAYFVDSSTILVQSSWTSYNASINWIAIGY